MSLLTPEELEKLTGAESLFASPIPVQSMSSDEFMPEPQTPGQREFEGAALAECAIRRGREAVETAKLLVENGERFKIGRAHV